MNRETMLFSLLLIFIRTLNVLCTEEVNSSCILESENGFCSICKQGHYCPINSSSKNGTQIVMEILCPPGHYCNQGVKKKCPAGTFGSREGLNTRICSGLCHPGYYCEEGSVNPIPCGNRSVFCPVGSSTPIKVSEGKYSYNSSVFKSGEESLYNATMSWQKDCQPGHYCVSGVRYPCPSGTFNPYSGKSSVKDCRKCKRGWYCKSGSRESKQFPCGGIDRYCEEGSSEPLYVSVGHYTTGGEAYNHNRINHRTNQMICPVGHYCDDGAKFPCPRGRYGNQEGLMHELCSGFCPAGSYCPEGTDEPIPCPHDTYASAGWHRCVQCQTKEKYERCKHHRSCCDETENKSML
jgi:hypothetical protein